MTTDASGGIAKRQTYYAYGTVRTTSGTLPTDYTFTGQKLDASSGLMYYGARYYDAAIGRFAQPDSIVADLYNPQSLNRYSYTLNNPVRYTDPTGHSACEDLECKDPEPSSPGPEFYGTSSGDGGGGGDTPAKSGGQQSPCDQTCAGGRARDYEYLYNQTSASEYGGHLKEYYGYLAAYYYRVSIEGIDSETAADMAGAVQAAKDRLIINGYEGEYQAYSTAWQLAGGEWLMGLPAMAAGVVSATGSSPLSGYTSHGLNQAIGREGKGVSSAAILDAVKNPQKVVPQEGGKMLYQGKDAVVILNRDGLLISTWATNHNGWRIK